MSSDIVTRVLDGWKRGIDEQRPADVAAYFTEDALFQGSHPAYSLGSKAVQEYYSEPHAAGLHVDYEVREIRPLADGIISAFVDPVFTRPDGTVLRYRLTVIIVRSDNGDWLISHYHVSRIS